MYSLLHETDEPTTVNFSAWAKFLPEPGQQLATVGANCLKFYRLNPYFNSLDPENLHKTTKTRLECLLSFMLMAPVRSMAVVRLKSIQF